MWRAPHQVDHSRHGGERIASEGAFIIQNGRNFTAGGIFTNAGVGTEIVG